MQLEFAMMADAVLTTADNKLIIQGANIDHVRAPGYPAVHSALALVAMFLQEPSDDEGEAHQFRVDMLNPLGEVWLPSVQGTVTAPPSQGERHGKASAVVNFAMLVFPMPGHYVFRLFLDDQFLRSLDFYAVEVPQTGESATSTQSHDSDLPTAS